MANPNGNPQNLKLLQPGKDHPRWRDDRIISSHGYAKVRVGTDHPLADPNGYAYEHLLVWASAGNDLPGPGDLIHHKNGVKTDNRIGNLELKSRIRHSIEHQPTALRDDQVRELRMAYASGEADMPTLARRYQIPHQTVSKLIRGKSRRNAGGPISDRDHRRKRAGRELDGRTWDQYPEAR